MKLVVEAGSTNTQSVLINNNGEVMSTHKSIGINPVTDKNFDQAVIKLCEPYINSSLKHIYYYGSGCINNQVNLSLQKSIQKHLTTETGQIEIYDDLFGSARAACQREKGVIAICGTGSISGYYDGKVLKEKLASGGYLLGDEGSGFDIGRRLMIRFVRQQLSTEEQKIITKEINLQSSEFITKLYQEVNVRKYLASTCILINKMSEETKVSILNEAFDCMCEKMIAPLWLKHHAPVHFIGSVSFYFRDILNDILKKFDIIAHTYEPTAIKGLVNYHRHE